MTWPKKLLVLAAAVCAMATPVFPGQVLPAPSKPSIGQSGTQPSDQNHSAAEQSDAEFEVVSIKQNKYPGGAIMLGLWGERFRAKEMTLRGLIRESFEIEEDQLAGEPHWVQSESYDVEAKVDHSVAEHLHQLSFDQRLVQYHRMLQTVLATRRCSSTSFSAIFSRNRYSLARSTAERRFFSSLVIGRTVWLSEAGGPLPQPLQNPETTQ